MKQPGWGALLPNRVGICVVADGVSQALLATLSALSKQTVREQIEVTILDVSSGEDPRHFGAELSDSFPRLRILRRGEFAALPDHIFGDGESWPTALGFMRAGDLLPEDGIEALIAKLRNSDVVLGNVDQLGGPEQLEWAKNQSIKNNIVSVESHPQVLSSTHSSGKLFRSVYVRGLLSSFESFDQDEFEKFTYLAILGARRVQLVQSVVFTEAETLTDKAGLETKGKWFNPLELAELGFQRHRYLTVKQWRAVEYHFIRKQMENLITAAGTLSEGDLKNYFSRVQALVAQCRMSRIEGIAASLRFRVGFYSLLADDFALFSDFSREISSLEVRSGAAFIKPSTPAPEHLIHLLKVKEPRAYAEHSFVRGGRVFISGKLLLPGLFGAALDNVSVRLSTRGRGLAGFVPLTVRTPLPQNESMGVYEWEAEIAPERDYKDSPLDFRIETLSGGFTIRLRYSLGFSRTSRRLSSKHGLTQCFPSDEQRVTLTHMGSKSSARPKRSWRVAMVKRDVKGFLAKRPLSGWLLIRLLTLPLKRREYWLLGERKDTAQDSSFALFQWLTNEKKGIRPRYVLERNTPAWKRNAHQRGLIAHGSLKHKLVLLHARVLISTQDIDSYMIPDDWNRVAFRNELSPRLSQRRVFLQHGVTHNGVGPQLHRGVTGLDLLVCASPQEAGYLQETTGYDSEIVTTGFPRYDRLFEARNTPKSTRVLLMPTWRRYLVAPSYSVGAIDPGNFVGSRYEEFFSSFLGNSKLHSLLEQSGLEIDFVPHYETAAYFENESLHPNIRIITDGGSQLPQMLASTPLLITDYSSVMFDVAYAGGSVVQLLFDYEDFYTRHYRPGWYDPRSNGLGETATNVEEAVNVFEGLIKNRFASHGIDKGRVSTYFAHHDGASRHRVFETISNVL